MVEDAIKEELDNRESLGDVCLLEQSQPKHRPTGLLVVREDDAIHGI